MKTKLIALALAVSALVSACSAETKTIEGITYATYGLINETDNRNKNIQYEISGWSLAWSIIFAETLVVPFYFIGFDLYEPVGKRDPSKLPGQI